MNEHERSWSYEMRQAEKVLARHGVPDERGALLAGPRPKAAIDAIIRDIQALNAEEPDGA